MSQWGGVSPIFEGNMPLQKIDPKKWRPTGRHNRNPVKLKLQKVLDMNSIYYPKNTTSIDNGSSLNIITITVKIIA